MQQPDGTHLGECPLCFLSMPIDLGKSIFWTCCSETICNGCIHANYMSNINDKVKAKRCPFCREPAPRGKDEANKRVMKRIKANDPDAINYMGAQRYDQGDYDAAFNYATKAAELGNAAAHYQLGIMFGDGEGVEKDEEKAVFHFEKAAIGGHPQARHELACYEGRNGNAKRAVRHLIIAANLGNVGSMKALWGAFNEGDITKEDLDATLRSHQDALNAMKSAQRDAADVACRGLR